MPSLLPAHLRLARSPAASTGNNKGPQRPPCRPCSEAAQGGKGPLSAFVSASPALGLRAAPGS